MNKTNYTLDQLKQCEALGLNFLVYLANDNGSSEGTKGGVIYATYSQHLAQKAMNTLAQSGFAAIDLSIAETRHEIEAAAAAKYSAQKAALETWNLTKEARASIWSLTEAARKAQKSAKAAKADAVELEEAAEAAVSTAAFAWDAIRRMEAEAANKPTAGSTKL